MLTRLKIKGFKNLVDVDVRFGAFTCIAGANGVGKSNLFDAIQFLSQLAQKNFIEAALSIRGGAGSGRAVDVRNLFHRVGDVYGEKICFEAEMIIARSGVDELRQQATASTTFVQYVVELGYQEDEELPTRGQLVLLKEELNYLKRRDFAIHIPFPHKPIWRNSVLMGRQASPFISTEQSSRENGHEEIVEPIEVSNKPHIFIKLHQDQNSRRPKKFLAANLPRTVLSTTTASESPTAFLVQQEMRSWRLLQLEPSVLRQADEFIATPSLLTNGQHLPATLDYLSRYYAQQKNGHSATWLYEQVAHRISQLIDDVYKVGVDRDEQRQLLTVEVQAKDNTKLPARALSDGTLRFLALSILEMDPRVNGLICLEEPENGIHPKRIPAMLQLLQDMAMDLEEVVDEENPLRQVIINTHAPAVVFQVPIDSLLIAYSEPIQQNGQQVTAVQFGCLPQSWRAQNGSPIVAMGQLMAYLKIVVGDISGMNLGENSSPRVIDSPIMQPYLFPDREPDYA